MNLRDVKPHTLKRMASECENDYDEWFKLCEGLEFGTRKPLEPRDIWRTAYSKGAAAVLRRVDALKEGV